MCALCEQPCVLDVHTDITLHTHQHTHTRRHSPTCLFVCALVIRYVFLLVCSAFIRRCGVIACTLALHAVDMHINSAQATAARACVRVHLCASGQPARMCVYVCVWVFSVLRTVTLCASIRRVRDYAPGIILPRVQLRVCTCYAHNNLC